jgi:hypothetical protein
MGQLPWIAASKRSEKIVKDYRASIEKLRGDAVEAALIRDLALDPIKREFYDRLHKHFNSLADEVEQALKFRTAPTEVANPPQVKF